MVGDLGEKVSYEYVNRAYKVNARAGARVRIDFAGTHGNEVREGTIIRHRGTTAYIHVRLDGEKTAHPYHPTWRIQYLSLTEQPNSAASAPKEPQ